jgi:hypothetical protein
MQDGMVMREAGVEKRVDKGAFEVVARRKRIARPAGEPTRHPRVLGARHEPLQNSPHA